MGLLIRVAGGPADSHLGLWAYLSVLPLARGSAGSQLGIWAYLSVLPKVLLIAIWAYGPTVPVRVARGPAGSQLPQSLLQFPVTEIDGSGSGQQKNRLRLRNTVFNTFFLSL